MSKKHKVAFVISGLNAGGAERVVSNLANELVNSFDITIILLYKCTPFYKLDERISITYCTELYNPKPKAFQSLKNHFKIFSSVLKILKENQIDLSIGFMTTSNIYLSIASKLNGKPCIISERIHPDHRQLNIFWQKLRHFSYQFSQVLVVQTASIKEYFETFMDSEKIIIIKNPLATELIAKKETYNSRENIILNVGSLTVQKNQDLLINAFSNVDNTDWKLVLVGDGELKSQYQDLIYSLKLEQKVTLVGNVNNVEDYYNNASIFVFPSRYEGFPNALTEAMYFGLPCISTACPSGPSEIINSGINGFLIQVENQLELENRLTTLMIDENLRKKFSKRAMESTTEFLPQTINTDWKNIINQILT
ncbi:glycosyltransferase family 4 protein [Gelidibacter gilvus]|uniref:Glycosyltransferase family 4 protein n=1 Tax=Gelidibacter gilvus TaxID=59602 RepID=A0A4Q0XEI1_9FLAO|nr:glycosyltransferase family 4 protein [Gelidibacter gilvus]RXJ45968.1 glycosyltransferase family 4 protein [Gelidibacter gilvus]